MLRRQRQDFLDPMSSVVTANLLVVLVLLLGLSGGLGDTVQITLAGLGDAATTLVLILLEDANLLEGLEDLAVDGAGGVDVLGGAGTTVLGGTVDLAETADTDGLAEVDVAGDGGGAHVEPVNVLGRELLGDASLDGVDPACSWSEACGNCREMNVHTRNGQLALALQESRIGGDELLRLRHKPISMIPSSEVLRPPRACSSQIAIHYKVPAAGPQNHCSPVVCIEVQVILRIGGQRCASVWCGGLMGLVSVEGRGLFSLR